MPCGIRIGLSRCTPHPGSAMALQAGRDVDPVAQKIAISDHYVAHMNPYAKAQGALRVCPGACSESLLDLARTLDGVHSAQELGEHTVPCCVGDPTPMFRYQPVHDFTMGGEGSEGSDLILAHKTGVIRDIRSKNGRQPPFNLVLLRTHRTPGAVPDQLCCRSGRVSSLHLGSARSCRQAWPNVSGRRG